MSKIIPYIVLLCVTTASAQPASLSGRVRSEGRPVEFAVVFIQGTRLGANTGPDGAYTIPNIPAGTYTAVSTGTGFEKVQRQITLKEGSSETLDFELKKNTTSLGEVVVSGTMKEVSKLESAVPVEVYTAKFFQANPTSSVYECLQHVNGVRPQINCNVCNTGDIHINGLEGPYTMVLIDGMPVVSGLSTVYGLNGIPQSLIERVEIVKGPASTLYGSEAVGGLINIITKKPGNVPLLSADVFGTSWGELNADVAAKLKAGRKAQSLLGINYFNYQVPIDNNKDGFTDVTLQNRISVFNKWSFDRKNGRVFSLAGRYVYEDRWGGDMNWTKAFRGGDSLYGESIYTKRWELFGTYQLPLKEKLLFQFSANGHDQNSVYGDIPYIALQNIGFGQLTWDKTWKQHDLLLGTTLRYTFYDDNTPATSSFDTTGAGQNMPSHTWLPGVFLQDEIRLNEHNKLLLGMRYDYHSIHGHIFTPRLNYKWSSKQKKDIVRLSFGNGYRVANVFTEDHAALTGAREVVFLENLRPEISRNANINYVKKLHSSANAAVSLDATAFYTRFGNKIIADYETDPNKIIYANLDGYAVSEGISLNLDILLSNGLKVLAGGTAMNVYSMQNGQRIRQLFTENYTGVWNIGYTFNRIGLTFDYTGNVYGPMRLPLLGDLDPRSAFSPWWSIQNIQLTKAFKNGLECYVGIKNLLNWTPNKGNPFIIARSSDPFDRRVQFDAAGQVIPTPDNPYGLTFDPSYVYAPNQGIRGFLGARYRFR